MEEPIYNIQRVVLNVIEDLKDFGVGMKDYRRLENIAVRDYRRVFRMGTVPSLVSEYINIDYATRVWQMPGDLFRYTKVAYEIGGRLLTLGVDPTLSLAEVPDICAGSIDTFNLNTVTGGFYFAPGVTGQRVMYAMGGGFNINYYRADYDRRIIIFSEQLPPSRAVVEYLSAGKNVNAMTLVPVASEDALDKYLKWQFCSLSKNLRPLAPEFEAQYEMARIRAIQVTRAFNIEEGLDQIYRSSGFRLR